MAFRKGMACGSWQFAVPPYAIVPMKKSGAAAAVGFRNCGLCILTSKMKNYCGLIAPVEALPCSNEVRGSEA